VSSARGSSAGPLANKSDGNYDGNYDVNYDGTFSFVGFIVFLSCGRALVLYSDEAEAEARQAMRTPSREGQRGIRAAAPDALDG